MELLMQQFEAMQARVAASEVRAQQAEQAAAAATQIPTGPSFGSDNGYGAWASKYQPEIFMGEDETWPDWSRVFRAWTGRFQRGRLKEIMKTAEGSTTTCKVVAIEGTLSNAKEIAAELYHVLIFFVRGRALKLTLKAGEGEGLEAWRLIVNRYEPTTVANSVGRLVEILSSDFSGDIVDELTEFERKVKVWEDQNHETMSDKMKIGVVVKGLHNTSLKEHMLLAASKATSYVEFAKELESIETAKKTLQGPQPMAIDEFQGHCGYCKKKGHKEFECRIKKSDQAKGGGKASYQKDKKTCHNCGKLGHIAKDCWAAKQHGGKNGKADGGKKGGGKYGKAGRKGKKGLHDIGEEDEGAGWDNETEKQYEQDWTKAGQAQGSAQKEGANLEQLGGLSFCELGLEMAGTAERDDPTDREITFGVDTAACKTVVPSKHPAARGYVVHRDSLTGTEYTTAGTSTVKDEGKRVLCAQGDGPEPLVIPSRKAPCRRPLLAVKDLTNKGQWVVFGPTKAFAYQPQGGRVTKFDNTPSGWNWTLKLDAPNMANRKVLEALERRKEEQELQVEAAKVQSGGLPTDMPEAVRRMITDGTPFVRQVKP